MSMMTEALFKEYGKVLPKRIIEDIKEAIPKDEADKIPMGK